jgi:hypothetical protein
MLVEFHSRPKVIYGETMAARNPGVPFGVAMAVYQVL